MDKRNGFETDTSMWPLVVLRAATRVVTDAEIADFVAGQKQILGRKQRFVEVCDTRGTIILPPSQRKLVADFVKETNPVASELCAGIAAVVGNPLYQGAMTAILWLFKPSYPVRAVTSLDEAADFLGERAKAAGLHLPDRAFEHLKERDALARHG